MYYCNKFKHKNCFLFNKNNLNFPDFEKNGYNPNKELISFFKQLWDISAYCKNSHWAYSI